VMGGGGGCIMGEKCPVNNAGKKRP